MNRKPHKQPVVVEPWSKYLIPFEPDWYTISEEIVAGDPEDIDIFVDQACASRFKGGREAWDAHRTMKPYAAAQFARHVASLLGM